jgi:hypothetical protein
MKLRITNSPQCADSLRCAFALAMSAFAFAGSGTWSSAGSVPTDRDGGFGKRGC